MIDAGQDLLRLEVSHSLEPVYTDAFVKYVENQQMVPFFRSGQVADGILATTELIVSKAQDAARRAAFDDAAHPAKSGGGGATSKARIGARGDDVAGGGPVAGPGSSPAQTLRAYFDAMANRNGSPDLSIYTPDTRAMLKGWTITPAQMDMVVRSYRKGSAESARHDGSLAVIRYPIAQRACAPFFFRKSAQGWQLDLTMMQKAIRFGRSNAWRFEPSADHSYEFAFADWIFDRSGFPKLTN